MTKKQKNELDSYDAILKLASKKQAITDTVPMFKDGIIALEGVVKEIRKTSGEQSQPTTGVTKDKSGLRDTLDATTYSIISPARAWAISEKNLELSEKLNFSQSEISDITDESIEQDAQNFYELITPHLSELVDAGITTTMMSEWETNIGNYSGKKAAPTDARIHKSTLTLELKKLFNDARDIRNDILNLLIISFKKKNSHYYNEYLKGRKVINLGSRTTTLEVFVGTSQGSPIYNAEVKLIEKDIVTATDIEGVAIFSPIKQGTYTLRASADGYQPQTTAPFKIKLGSTVDQTFELENSLNLS